MYILLFVALVLFYYYLTKNYDYWKKRNVKYERPWPIFGNMYRNIVGQKSMAEIATEYYRKYPNEKVVGLFYGTTPVLIVRDLDLVKTIMTVDFQYFYVRGQGRDPKREPIFANLFHGEGDVWKMLRQRCTPAFTSAKLKKMFPLIVECANKLQTVSENIVTRGGECDVRELMARFTTEFIAACGLGLQVDSINNENSRFRSLGKLMFNRNRSWSNIVLMLCYDLFPDFGTILQILLSDPSLLNTFSEIVENVRAQKNYKPSDRHDFVDLLMEMEAKGKIMVESIEKSNAEGKPVLVEMEMGLLCMAAQVFVFFGAGFETSSSATSYLLHELALHPEEQIKIQEDIDRVLVRYDNKLCYDSIAEMALLGMAFKESLRKFPSCGTLHRMCARRYTIPDLGITLDPGVKIIIPAQGIHTDEQYFEDPLQFKPERFADMETERHKFAFLPFGEGPRMCIGARLAEMQSLAGLAALLQKFTVEPSRTTKRVPEVNPYSNTVQSVKGGLPLILKKRNY